jgi:Ca2+/Na+ antiporter
MFIAPLLAFLIFFAVIFVIWSFKKRKELDDSGEEADPAEQLRASKEGLGSDLRREM